MGIVKDWHDSGRGGLKLQCVAIVSFSGTELSSNVITVLGLVDVRNQLNTRRRYCTPV